MGHNDARFTFSVHQKAAKRREKLTGRYLEVFDAACEWAQMGTKAGSGAAVFKLVGLAGGRKPHRQAIIE
jgi:hypothetical protein